MNAQRMEEELVRLKCGRQEVYDAKRMKELERRKRKHSERARSSADWISLSALDKGIGV